MKVFKLCTAIVLLMNLTSCGTEVPVMHNVMEQWAKKKSKQQFEKLVKQRYMECAVDALRMSCTIQRPRARYMYPREFFGPFCHERYLNCLEGNTTQFK